MSWIPKIYRDKKLSAPLKASFIIVLLSIVSAGHALHVKINEYLVTIKGNWMQHVLYWMLKVKDTGCSWIVLQVMYMVTINIFSNTKKTIAD